MATATAKAMLELTPHKVAICHLIQTFAPPAESPVPSPFDDVASHNRFGLFLFSVTRASDAFAEPSLCNLTAKLRGVRDMGPRWLGDYLSQCLVDSLRAIASPDDLVTFFDRLRDVLSPPMGANYTYDRIFLDPNSHLGVFLRSCLCAFNSLTFEAVCHLLTNIGAYCNSADSRYEFPEYAYNSDFMEILDKAAVDHDDAVSDKFDRESESSINAGVSSSFHNRAPQTLPELVEGSTSSTHSKLIVTTDDSFQDDQVQFLRSKWQVAGFLEEQANLLEKHPSLLPLNSCNAVLKQIQKMDPEFHRVRYLKYLNNLHHEDYIEAVDSLHSYFDFSAGMEGTFKGSPNAYMSDMNLGRYESALLCLGTLHCHFGHSKLALRALTEAVHIAQLNDDNSCLAYTLATICNLLSEIGISSSFGINGSLYALGTNMGMGMVLSTQQQLLVLLKKCQKRAEDLKLVSLVGFNRLAFAKFDLKNVKRPLLSFGPKGSTQLRTSPISVSKGLRLSSYLLSEFGSDKTCLQLDHGSFSTSWIKNLQLLRCSSPLSSPVHRLNEYDRYSCGAQPNPIPATILQLAGASYLLRSTSWELYGSAPLARLNTLVHLTCFADASSSADLSLAYVKLIQHLAVFKGYKEAFNAFKLAEEKFPSIGKSHIQLLKLQLLHEHAIHRGNLKLAQEVCDEFSVLSSSVSGVDLELKTEASLRHARTLLAAKQFNQAADVAHSLYCRCYKYNLHVENGTVLLLLAEIYKKSGNAVLGLPYALASLSFCQSFNLDLLEASAMLTVSELWLSLGSTHAKQASTFVTRALPLILGHGGLELRARANIVQAKCHLSDPDFSVVEDVDVVLESLNQATEDLEILEYHEMAVEAFYLLAMVYNMLGQDEEREEAASAFKRHTVTLQHANNEDDRDTYGMLNFRGTTLHEQEVNKSILSNVIDRKD